jgi:hypothetical protein
MPAQTYCFNSATGAVTVWPNYAFVRVWRVGNIYFGVTKQGVFRLGGNDDNGAPFVSKFRTSKNTMGTNATKRVPYVRLNDSVSGIARAFTDNGSSQSTVTFTKAERIKFGKGLRGRTYAFEIETTQQGFRIQNMEFFIEKLQRGVD